MDKVIVVPRDEMERQLLRDFLNKNGIRSMTEEEYGFEKRMEARRKLVELSKTVPRIDITDEEIDAIVEEVRSKRFAEQNNQRH